MNASALDGVPVTFLTIMTTQQTRSSIMADRPILAPGLNVHLTLAGKAWQSCRACSSDFSHPSRAVKRDGCRCSAVCLLRPSYHPQALGLHHPSVSPSRPLLSETPLQIHPKMPLGLLGDSSPANLMMKMRHHRQVILVFYKMSYSSASYRLLRSLSFYGSLFPFYT